MAEAMYLPYEYVDHLRKPGLKFSGGTVALNRYMCKNVWNGGNDSANSLYSKLRKMKDGGTGPTFTDLLGSSELEVALKGQGRSETFVKIWDFLCRNKEQMKTVNVEACGRRENTSEGYEKQVLKKGNVYDLYFKGRSDQQAIQMMVDDRFFGIDCIGFTAGVLIFNNEWTKYHGGEPLQWASWFCTEEVYHAKDILPLDFMIWKGHIAMIDWVWEYLDDKRVLVDICQSSSGEVVGPQCNERVILKETSVIESKRRMFKFEHTGSPRAPVTGNFFIQRRKKFFY